MSQSPDSAATDAANDTARKPLRLAALGDLHVGENMDRPYRELFAKISQEADVLALCGDLVDYGLPKLKFFCRNSARF